MPGWRSLSALVLCALFLAVLCQCRLRYWEQSGREFGVDYQGLLSAPGHSSRDLVTSLSIF